jgi:ketosteroid isomerase-like protein
MQPTTYLLAAVGALAAAACSGSTKADTAAARDSATPAGATAAPAAGRCGATDVTEVRQAIEAAYARADAGLRRGDPEPLWALYAEDAIYMWDNQRMWRGKAEARREAPKALGDLSFKAIKETIDDLLVCGELAVVAGRFDIMMQRASGSEVRVTGKNLVVWRRQPDGSWKIVRNLGNDDARMER